MNSNSTSNLRVLLLGVGYLGLALKERFEERGDRCFTVDIEEGRAEFTADVTDDLRIQRLADDVGFVDVVIVALSTKGGDVESYERLYGKSIELVNRYFASSRRIFCSSSALYGVQDGRWVTEEHVSAPLYPQGKVLLDIEHAMLRAGGVVARLAPIYGPMRCALVERFLNGDPCLRGPFSRWLSYIHRDDAVTAIEVLAKEPNLKSHCYNICDATPITLQEAYDYLVALTHLPMPQEASENDQQPKRGGSNQRLSCSRMLSLGWLPLYPSFMDGVHGVLESFGVGN